MFVYLQIEAIYSIKFGIVLKRVMFSKTSKKIFDIACIGMVVLMTCMQKGETSKMESEKNKI